MTMNDSGINESMAETYDYIVIGAGSAGCVGLALAASDTGEERGEVVLGGVVAGVRDGQACVCVCVCLGITR